MDAAPARLLRMVQRRSCWNILWWTQLFKTSFAIVGLWCFMLFYSLVERGWSSIPGSCLYLLWSHHVALVYCVYWRSVAPEKPEKWDPQTIELPNYQPWKGLNSESDHPIVEPLKRTLSDKCPVYFIVDHPVRYWHVASHPEAESKKWSSPSLWFPEKKMRGAIGGWPWSPKYGLCHAFSFKNMGLIRRNLRFEDRKTCILRRSDAGKILHYIDP